MNAIVNFHAQTTRLEQEPPDPVACRHLIDAILEHTRQVPQDCERAQALVQRLYLLILAAGQS